MTSQKAQKAQRKAIAKGQRSRLVALLGAALHPADDGDVSDLAADPRRTQKLMAQLKSCSTATALVAGIGGGAARAVDVGCKARACPACAVRRADVLSERWQPLFQRLLDIGCELDFVTLTRAVPARLALRDGMTEIWDAWRAVRQSTANRKKLAAAFVGGIAAREFTWYVCTLCRKGVDDCRCRDPQLRRRVHAHIHMVAIRRPGTRKRAARMLTALWVRECKRRGWKAEHSCQDSATITGEHGPAAAAAYAVKYACKPSELRSAADIMEATAALHSLRLVDCWGELHAGSEQRDLDKFTESLATAAVRRAEVHTERRAWAAVRLGEVLPMDLAQEVAARTREPSADWQAWQQWRQEHPTAPARRLDGKRATAADAGVLPDGLWRKDADGFMRNAFIESLPPEVDGFLARSIADAWRSCLDLARRYFEAHPELAATASEAYARASGRSRMEVHAWPIATAELLAALAVWGETALWRAPGATAWVPARSLLALMPKSERAELVELGVSVALPVAGIIGDVRASWSGAASLTWPMPESKGIGLAVAATERVIVVPLLCDDDWRRDRHDLASGLDIDLDGWPGGDDWLLATGELEHGQGQEYELNDLDHEAPWLAFYEASDLDRLTDSL